LTDASGVGVGVGVTVTLGETTADGDALGVGPGPGVHPAVGPTANPTTTASATPARLRGVLVTPGVTDPPRKPPAAANPRRGVVPLPIRMAENLP